MKIDGKYFSMRIRAAYEQLQPWRQRQIERFRGIWTHRLKILRFGLWAGGISMLLFGVFIVLVYVGAFGPLPSYSDVRGIQNNIASEVYSEDDVLLGRYYIENRVNADFDEIPISLVNALVATEDARFFEHSGVDARALLRVAIKTILLSDRSAGGGSTISQQLAKNVFKRNEYGVLTIPVNKLREIFVARRLEKVYEKEELLRLYLNTVPFGENIFGIKVASQRFFNKSADQLKLEEAAVLVGMLKANSYYNPVNHPDRAASRRNVVLSQMVRYGYLNNQIADSLYSLPVSVDVVPVGYDDGLATYFRAHLIPELKQVLAEYPRPNGKPYNLYTDGLKIYTTIDSRLQAYAEEAMRDQMIQVQDRFEKDWSYTKRKPWLRADLINQAIKNSKRYQNLKKQGKSEEDILALFEEPHAMTIFNWDADSTDVIMSSKDSVIHSLKIVHGGLIAIAPKSGIVRAWVGGIDHRFFEYDHVKSRRPVGSTFKPLVYAQALESGIDPCQYIQNTRRVYPEYEDWSPRNSDGEYAGFYSMAGALSQSVNTVTVELLMQTGIDTIRAFAKNMGFQGDIPKGPAIGLGAMDGSLLELATVYGAFANNGKKPVLHYLDRIETASGDVIVSFRRPDPRTFEQVVEPQVNVAMVDMLQAVVDEGTARRLRYEFGLEHAIGAKTGTTQNQSDGWFMSMTPDLVVGAWVGADNPQVHFRTMWSGQGANTALPIAGQFLKQVYRDPQFRKWGRSKFRALPDSLAFYLDCPPYLEDIPVAEELLEFYLEDPAFFVRMYQELMGREEYFGAEIDIKRRRKNETDEEYFSRMRRYNQRLQKKKDEDRQMLKDFWSKKLFGKKKQNQE